MPELTPSQIGVLERLIARGFAPAAFPLYANVVGVRRGAFAALLDPSGGALRTIGEPSYLLEGNLSACIETEGRRWFVWKSKRVPASDELLAERQRFTDELAEALSSNPPC